MAQDGTAERRQSPPEVKNGTQSLHTQTPQEIINNSGETPLLRIDDPGIPHSSDWGN